METKINQKELKRQLSYNPASGDFTWIITKHGIRSNKLAGCLDPNGYSHVKIDGTKYKSHRLAWLYMTGKWPKGQIDHINRNRKDNRFINLRSVTNSENQRNVTIGKNNTSRIKGVHFDKLSSRWVAKIHYDNKQVRLGSDIDFFETCCLRKSAEIKHNYN